MGIVAAQCRVFIAQNDICALRPLYYHLFLLDNRHVPARSTPRRLLDSLLFPSISQSFHDPSRLVSPRLVPRLVPRPALRAAGLVVSTPFSPSVGVSSLHFGRLLCRSLSPSRCFSVRIERSSSRNRRVRGVPYRPMSSVQCRRSVPRSVFLRDGRGVLPSEAWGGEGGGAFYGRFHVKHGRGLVRFCMLSDVVRIVRLLC